MRNRQNIAKLVEGPRRLIGPAMLLLLALFPIVLAMPLLKVQAYFVSNEIILARVAHDLYFADRVLFVIIFGFGIVLPACKMIASVCCWYIFPLRSWVWLSNILAYLGKLSILDIVLIALVIVALKGVGVGTVRVEPGLYLYCVLVVGSNILNLVMHSAAHALYASTVAVDDWSPFEVCGG